MPDHGFTASAMCEWWRSVRGTVVADCPIKPGMVLECACREELTEIGGERA